MPGWCLLPKHSACTVLQAGARPMRRLLMPGCRLSSPYVQPWLIPRPVLHGWVCSWPRSSCSMLR